MHNGRIILFSTLFVLAACRDPGPGTQGNDVLDSEAAAATSAEPAAVEAARPPVERKTTFAGPIAGAIATLPFAYHVSVDREVIRKETGQKSREVGIEFLDTNVVDANMVLATEFEKAGFEIATSENQGNAIRTVYTKGGHGEVLVWVRPGAPRGERYALQMPDAKGTIYLAYPLVD